MVWMAGFWDNVYEKLSFLVGLRFLPFCLDIS